MAKKDKITFGIYSRKSKWTGKGESIENQIQLCKDYVNGKFGGAGKELAFKVYEDEGFSGKNTTRPYFQQMLRDIRARELDCIVCYRLDRISRSVGDFAKTVEELERYKVDFICIKEQFDTSTPMGKAMMNIAAVFAQLERETIAERIRDNMLLLAGTGRWLGGATPLGFASCKVEKIVDDGKIRTSHKLTPVKEEIALVELIFGRFLATESATAVETLLLEHGAHTRGSRSFTVSTIKELLSNPVYCVADGEAYAHFVKQGCIMCCEKAAFNGAHGVSVYNRTHNAGTYQSRQPMDEWVIAVGEHRGVIPSARWIKAQKLLYQNRIYPFQYTPKNKTNLLSGLLFCKSCGSQMRPRIDSHSTPDEHGQKTFSYLCDRKRKGGAKSCAAANLPGKALDQMVCDLLLDYGKAHGSSMHHKIVALKSRIASGHTTLHKQVEVVKASIAEKEHEVRGIIRLLSKDTENALLFQRMELQVQELTEEIQRLKDSLSTLEEEENAAVDCNPQTKTAMRALATVQGAFNHATASEKRELIHSLVERIEWDGAKVHLFLYGARQEQCS